MELIVHQFGSLQGKPKPVGPNSSVGVELGLKLNPGRQL
jgi:hypothetical protein